MTHVPRTVVLRPLLATRIACQAVPLGFLYVALIAVRAMAIPGSWTALAFIASAGMAVLFGVRSWRQSVTLAPDRIVVRGFLWSRTVSRDRVTGVSDFGWLVWTDARARKFLSPLTVFWIVPGALHRYSEHAARGLQRTQMWARKKKW